MHHILEGSLKVSDICSFDVSDTWRLTLLSAHRPYSLFHFWLYVI